MEIPEKGKIQHWYVISNHMTGHISKECVEICSPLLIIALNGQESTKGHSVSVIKYHSALK